MPTRISAPAGVLVNDQSSGSTVLPNLSQRSSSNVTTAQSPLMRRISTMFVHPSLLYGKRMSTTENSLNEGDIDSTNTELSVWRKIERSPLMHTILMLADIFVLFGDDIRLGFLSNDVDTAFQWIMIAMAMCVVFDIVIGSLADTGFIFSFYFWIDTLSALSIVLSLIPVLRDNQQSRDLIRAARAAKMGGRSALVILKLRSTQARLPNQPWYRMLKRIFSSASIVRNHNGSRLVTDLNVLICKRATVAVLIIVAALPLLYSIGSGNDKYLNHELLNSELDILEQMVVRNSDPSTLNAAIRRYFDAYIDVTDWIPLSLQLYGKVVELPLTFSQVAVDISKLRPAEIVSQVSTSGLSVAIFNGKAQQQLGYRVSIGLTVFIIGVLMWICIAFSKDVNQLVVEPVENLVARVRKIADDPLNSNNFKDLTIKGVPQSPRNLITSPSSHQVSPSEAGAPGTKGLSKLFHKQHKKKDSKTHLEIRVLEQAVSKIVELLALGFGEAGREVIRKSLKIGGQSVDAVSLGQKVHAIFGFCDIRNFTDICECLQQDVMKFTNQIARIVHGDVQFYGGHCNKNIGDAFLLVWRLPDLGSKDNGPQLEFNLKSLNMLGWEQLADNALISFIKIIADINRSAELIAYRNHPAIKERFGNDFQVSMGFGLHVGWAIEGAIGSRFKIDASYLSPNVNLTARLESATKQFGVPILLSEPFVQLLSQTAQLKIRKIDNVIFKGVSAPVGLYTFDITDNSPLPRPNGAHRPITEAAVSVVFRSDLDVIGLQRSHPKQLLPTFRKAFTAYENGDWKDAVAKLQQCLSWVPKDGPSLSLLSYMKLCDDRPPDGFKGFRALEFK